MAKKKASSKGKTKNTPAPEPQSPAKTKVKGKATLGGLMARVSGVLVKEFQELSEALTTEFVSTGNPYLDRVISGQYIGGGVPVGGVVEISGPQSSGKTTFSLGLIRRYLNHFTEDEGALYFDFENSVDKRYAKRAFGLNLDNTDPRLWYGQLGTVEEARAVLGKVFSIAEEEGVCPVRLVVIDSIAAMNTEEMIENALAGDNTKQLGLQAAGLGMLLREYIRLFKKHRVTLLVTNQLRSRINLTPYSGGPDEDTAGGRALKFYTWVRITLKPAGKVEISEWEPEKGTMGKRKLLDQVRVSTMKNKVGTPFLRDMVHIRYGYGFDTAYTTVIKGTLYGLFHPDSKNSEADRQRNKQVYVKGDGRSGYTLWQYETHVENGQPVKYHCAVDEQKDTTGKRKVRRTALLTAPSLEALSELLLRPENQVAWKYLVGEVLSHYERDDQLYMTPAEKAAMALEFAGTEDYEEVENDATFGIDAGVEDLILEGEAPADGE